VTAADWTPEVADVGALLRARTKDTAGNEVGTFNEDTRPTGAQVETLITQAQADLVAELGSDDVSPRYLESAKRLVIIGAAMNVELSYFPEQVGTGRSPYDQLSDLYERRLKSFMSHDVLGADAEAGPTSPVYEFPPLRAAGW
jgi:hypothetical protein